MKSECTISTVLPEPPESLDFPGPTPSDPVISSLSRSRAAAEVLICSGYPTQLLIIAALGSVGIRPGADGTLSPAFIFGISALDTVLLLSLVFFFLRRSNDRPRDVFLKHQRATDEIRLGLMLVPVIFLTVVVVQLGIRVIAPLLHNVEVSPFQSLLASPWLLAGFVALVLVAGGVREELQRAFLLHRFEQRLGGGSLGVALTSLAFGLGHTVQGWDAAIVTALMGAFWGVLYLSRRSVVSTITNHAVFNVTQIVLGYATLARA
ncbi:MAG TPA: type II CAAX endopeptidase family protein [Vicinamibacterales bacterium]|nr:type II CAAX endopeptidase family protein [Vicinamibacterales bacterium]